MKRFNINNYVYVKLTEIGINELRKQHEELKKTFASVGEFRPPIVNDNGYSKFQAHALMSRFGHLMMPGISVPFETDVLFDDLDLNECKND